MLRAGKSRLFQLDSLLNDMRKPLLNARLAMQSGQERGARGQVAGER